MNVAEQFVHVLRQAGVERVYGVVGDSLNPLVDAIRRTVFVQIPYRGVDSIREHSELIELLRSRAPAAEIEAAARAHKLHTVESFRSWRREHEHQLEGHV